MADNQPRKTLGDSTMHQGPRHFSSIVIPQTAKAVEIELSNLDLISARHAPQQLNMVNTNLAQQQHLRCDFCGGNHLNGHCSYPSDYQEEENQGYGWNQEVGPFTRQPSYQQQQYYPSTQDRMTKLEDTLEKFIGASLTNQKNTNAAIRSLEIQFGQLAKQLSEKHLGQFSANTQTNPEEHCTAIITKSVKTTNLVTENEVQEQKESEEKDEVVHKKEEKEEDKREREEILPQLKNLPYPPTPSKKEKERQFSIIMDIFKGSQLNIPFMELMEKMPTYAKRMRKLLTKKRNHKIKRRQAI